MENINKFNNLEKTLQDRKKLAKEAAIKQVTLFHNNPSLSSEDREKSFAETKEDVRLGAEVSGLSEDEIKDVLREFDAWSSLTEIGLSEADEEEAKKKAA